MNITDLAHLETLAEAHQLAGAGKQIISLSLNQGVLLLSLNGKELLKTTLTENSTDSPSNFSISIGAAKFWRLYGLGKTSGVSSSALSLLRSQPQAEIYAFTSSSIKNFPI
jgi:hypothetical protein